MLGRHGKQKPFSYHSIGLKLAAMPLTLRELDLLEAHEGRKSIMDGMSALRSLTSACAAVDSWGFSANLAAAFMFSRIHQILTYSDLDTAFIAARNDYKEGEQGWRQLAWSSRVLVNTLRKMPRYER